MKMGCHISVSKGLLFAAQRAKSLGATAFQVFTKSPRSLRPKRLHKKDAEAGRRFCAENQLTLVTHTPYITNLSTPKPDLLEVTIRSISEDLMITALYGGIGAVVHCGKHVGEGEERGKERMVAALNEILAPVQTTTQEGSQPLLLLENTAGQGTELGTQLAELVELRAATRYPERIGFCFDTCHAFAAGIWQEETFPALLTAMQDTGFLPHLHVIHFNDSRTSFGSRSDRHAKIGLGKIGARALRQFLVHEAFASLPVLLETPVADEREYGIEIAYLHALRAAPAGQQPLPEVPSYE